MQPLAMVSEIISPKSEQRLVLAIETKDIVPLATSSTALRIVHVYVHVQLPFLNDPHVPALSQWMTKADRPYCRIAEIKPCKHAIDSSRVVL